MLARGNLYALNSDSFSALLIINPEGHSQWDRGTFEERLCSEHVKNSLRKVPGRGVHY